MLRKFALLISILSLVACGSSERDQEPSSSSGVFKATVKVPVGANGLTTEQDAVQRRLLEDNKPGAIKHLYIISTYSGQVILYSTVKGKVTSSGKRLSPSTVTSHCNGTSCYEPFTVGIGGWERKTNEVLQDDGTYGSSVEYVYWWDSRDVYHQHYVTGGQIVHVTSQPMTVKSIIINVEDVSKDK